MPEARAIVHVAPRTVEVRTVPFDPAPGSVLIRTLWSGISGGTESLAFRAEIDPEVPLDESLGSLGGTFRHPFRYGYSCVGMVERGTEGLPEGATVFAFHPHQDLVAAEPADVVPVDGVGPRLATMFPLVETALQISLDAGPVPGDTVGVFGLGPVGILTSLLLERHGASVVGIDPDGERRRVAAAAGILAVAEVAEAGDRGPMAVAVECSGNPDVARAVLPLLAHEGTLLVASWYGTKDVPLPLGGDFHRRRLVIRSTQVSTIPAALSARWTRERRRQVARDLLDVLPLKLLATHEFDLDDAQAAFEAVDRHERGLLHAAIRYR